MAICRRDIALGPVLTQRELAAFLIAQRPACFSPHCPHASTESLSPGRAHARAVIPWLLAPTACFPALPAFARRIAKVGKIEKKATFRRASGRNLYPGNSIVQEVAQGVRRIFQAAAGNGP